MRNFRTCIKGLVKLAGPSRFRVSVSCAVGMVRIGASLLFVWVSKTLVDIVSGNSDANLWLFISLMAATMLIQAFCGTFAVWWSGHSAIKTRLELRHLHFSKVLYSSWMGRDNFHSADTVNRIQEDISIVTDAICNRIPDIFLTVCQLIAASIYLLYLTPTLTWILIGLMVLAVVGSKIFYKPLRETTNRIRSLESEIQKVMQENLHNRVLILTLGCFQKVLESFSSIQTQVKDTTRKRLNISAAGGIAMRLGFSGGYLAAFLWGIFGIKEGSVTYGSMIAFLQLVGQIQRPVADAAKHFVSIVNSLSSVERLMELEELKPESQEGQLKLEGSVGVQIKNMSFGYPDAETKVFKNFDFDFKPGTMTVITGLTGAGKSTLARLILGLLKPGEGSIELYNNTTGGHHSDAGTRCNFMYVPQGYSLISGSIRENLKLADPDADEQKMKKALQLAEADFVFDLPEGLDSCCSEKGAGLSEGQAQRIAIARALMQEGGILILDEATSSLDAQTEKKILDNLAECCRDEKTIINISHRSAAQSYADKILNIDRQQ